MLDKKQKPKLPYFLSIILISLGGFFVFKTYSVQAAVGINHKINFQGKMINTDGTNVTNNSYNFLFCIYTSATPATPCTAGANNDAVWRESKSLTVTDGIFQTNLGDTTTLPGSVDFNSDNIYLGINFNSNGQMSPLVQFTSAPYAFNSDNLDGKDWAAPGAIGTTTPSTAIFTTINATAGTVTAIGNTTGTTIITSGGVSSWTNTSGNFTLSTTTSGTLALSSAGALNLSAASASTVTLANVTNALNYDANTLSIDALNNRIGIGTSGPVAYLDIKASDTNAPSLQINSGNAPSAPSNGNLWYDGTHLYFHSSTDHDLLASGGGMANPMTNMGDIIYGGASGAPARLTGSTNNGYVLAYNTTTNAPYWTAMTGGGMAISGAITGATSGSILFADSSNQLAQDNNNFFWNNASSSLGIGTKTTNAKLSIFSTGEQLRLSYDAPDYTKFTTGSDSKLTIETSVSTQSMLTMGKGTAQNAGVSFDGNTNDYYVGMDDATDNFMIGLGRTIGTTPYITMDATGKVGIGTVSPSAQLHTTGTVRFQNFGAGTLSTDSNGNLSVSSDERLKNITGLFSRGLESVLSIKPIIYRWNELSGMETQNEYAGFSAQDIQKNIPEAVGVDSRGFLTLSDRPILAATVNSIQQLNILMEAQNKVLNPEQLATILSQTKVTDLGQLIKTMQDQDAIFDQRITVLEKQITLQTTQIATLTNNAAITTSVTTPNGTILNNKNEVQALSQTNTIISGGLSFSKENDSEKNLSIEKAVQFLSQVTFSQQVIFQDKIIANAGIEIAGELTVGKDTAGYATIKQGSDHVKISFEKSYQATPFVNATLSSGQSKNKDLDAATAEWLLLSDIHFIVTNVSQDGFEIKINKMADGEVSFMWMAVSVKDPATAIGEEPFFQLGKDSSGDIVDLTTDDNATAETVASSAITDSTTDSGVTTTTIPTKITNDTVTTVVPSSASDSATVIGGTISDK